MTSKEYQQYLKSQKETKLAQTAYRIKPNSNTYEDFKTAFTKEEELYNIVFGYTKKEDE